MVVTRGERRAAWVGALMFGGGYLVLCFAPGFDRSVMPRLLSTLMSDRHFDAMSYAPSALNESVWVVEREPDREFVGRVFGFRQGTTGTAVAWGNGTRWFGPGSLRRLSRDAFRQLCHADLSLILAALGAFLGRLLAAGRAEASGP
jgi:hypothetical protein